MKQEEWNPGHSPKNLYPYNGIISHKTMPNRNNVSFIDDASEPKMLFDVSVYGSDEKKAIIKIAFEYKEALDYAEGQIQDLLKENPFMPEDIGFEVVLKPESVTDTPIRFYINKYDKSFSLFRTPGAESLTHWTLLKKNDDQTSSQTLLKLPCARIAYAALWSLGVTMISQEELDEIKKSEPSAKVQSEERHGTKKLYNVLFTRSGNESRTEPIPAENESEALSKAKFYFETSEENIQDILPEELSIIV